MAFDIDLIPQEEREVQSEKKLVKLGTVVSLALFFVVAIASGILFYFSNSLKNQALELDAGINKQRSGIKKLADIEISARNLDARTSTLKSIYAQSRYYSRLLDELEKRLPAEVVIESLGIGNGNSVSISGTGADYISLAKFISTVSNQKFEGAGAGLSSLFTNVTLNSVSLDQQTAKAKYFMVVEVNPTLLEKKND